MKTYTPTDFTIAQLAERLKLPYVHARLVILATVTGGKARLISGERKVRHYTRCQTNKKSKV